jgi:large subunit ribosomal protein L29
MKSEELRAMTEAELRKQLDDLYQELFNLRFQRASGQLSNTNRLRTVRRDLARVKTFLRQHELAAQRGAGGTT